MYICFIDYAKAFDCVSNAQLWKILTKIGFPVHIIDLIRKLYENQETTVRTNCGDTDCSKTERGVRHGCIMSPNLYNVYAEDIMREVSQNYEGGVKIDGVRYSNLRFAGDTTLMCSSKSELLELLKHLNEISKRRGLPLNTEKTKIMVVSSNRVEIEEFMLGGEKIEEADNFGHLGSVIDTSCKSSKEIRKWMAMAKSTVQCAKHLEKQRNIYQAEVTL